MTVSLKNLSAFSAIAAALALPAAAQLKYENGSGGYVSLYGQFSPAYQYADDGIDTQGTLVDNAHSNSRVGLWVIQPYAQGTFSFNFETALGLRPSDGVTVNSTPDAFDWDKTKLRKVDFAFGDETWGKIYAGQGSMATDGVADLVYGDTGMTTYNGISDFAGSFEFRTPGGGFSGVTVGDVAPSLDGGRRGRIRYDTPNFSGFTVSVAAGTEVLVDGNDDDYYDVALRYEQEFSGTKIKGGLGWSRRDRNGVDRDDTFGSIAVLFPNGFDFALAAGSRKDDGSYGYVKLGYEAAWFDIGSTSFALDYYDGSDFGLDGRSSEVMGFGVNQNVDSINTQFYAGFRKHQLSDPGVNYEDIDAYLIGARWKF